MSITRGKINPSQKWNQRRLELPYWTPSHPMQSQKKGRASKRLCRFHPDSGFTLQSGQIISVGYDNLLPLVLTLCRYHSDLASRKFASVGHTTVDVVAC